MPCPLCDYDLTGLPAEHTCPECGFKYDRHTTAVKLAARKRHYIGLASVAGYGLFMLYLAFRVSNPGDNFLLGIILVSLMVATYHFVRAMGHPSRLVLSRAGIRFDHPELHVDVIRWEDVVEARYSWITGVFQIRGSEEEALFRCRYDRLGTPRIARRCAKEINRLRPIYLAEADAVRRLR